MQQEDQLVVRVDGDDRRGLLALAALSGVDEDDAPRFGALVGDTFRRGLTSRLADVGLSWAPSPDEVQPLVDRLAAIEARPAVAAPAGPVPSGRGREPGGAGLLRSDRLRSAITDHRLRATVLVAAGVGFAVALVGGYAGRWGWTGFAANDQLWDWLHLVLLPVAFGTFPLWLQFASHMTRLRQQVLLGGVVVFGLFVAAGYLAPLLWTGFRGNTLWDWLTLIVLPVTLTTVRCWPTTRREIHRSHVVAFTSLGLGWLITLVGGYADHWAWTGYAGNTLWDWLQLLLAPIAINTVIVPAAIRWVSGDVATRAQKAADDEAFRAALLEIRRAVTPTPAGRPGRPG